MAELSRDPFDIPAHLLPPGIVYQWCAKTQFGKIDPQYQTMLDAGWRAVPFQRHADFFPQSYSDTFGTIQYGGQVLMERAKVVSDVRRETELDSACINAKQGRVVAVELALRLRLSASELESARAVQLSGSQYASRRIQMMADGVDDNLNLRGSNGALWFDRWEPPKVRRAYRGFAWLLNLISWEK
jgi:hypothetical protein